MDTVRQDERRHAGQDGFTLLEAMIAMAIVALVVASVLAVRTNSLIDASEARNWRVAREVAQEILSELSAGARESPLEYNMDRTPIPSMREVAGWSYQIVVGEERISSLEGDLESAESAGLEDGDAAERRNWQRERDDLRAARAKGMSFYDYRESAQLEEEERLLQEDAPPSEDEFEDVAVFVFFPNVRPGQAEQSHFVLKARLSTMALEGVTPEEAEAMGGGANAPGAAAGPGSGTGGTGGEGNGGR